MIPAKFDYEAPDGLDEVIRILHENGEDAKLLAGGHSLVPLMKLRLATPALLVDMRRVPGMHGIQRENGTWRIGAMTPHAVLEDTPELGIASTVAASIADRQVRNRGTIGGSLAHGDPASDLPAMVLATEATVTLRGRDAQRTVAAAELFRDYMETAIGPEEVLTEIRVPVLEGYGHAHRKFTRRREDWAMVGVVALVRREEDTCADVRVALTNMGSTPVRARAVEDALRGQSLTDEAIRAAAEHAAEGTDPPADLNASADYKRHLARVMTARALQEAAGSLGSR
ncbi:MAG TPA: xanthine dehydrogenase family protein subunit M [Solirubrobacteraceae bacterium]|nr:xanthine dehydrogenase family protein subunit M [Solirubrobacteraceae bacterium]